MMGDSKNDGPLSNGASCSSPACGGGVERSETEGADRLHDYLGRKLDNASYLLGFAYSIIESLTGGLPASDATLAEFRREYDAHFDPKGAQPIPPPPAGEVSAKRTVGADHPQSTNKRRHREDLEGRLKNGS